MTAITISDFYNRSLTKIDDLSKTITNDDLLIELEKQITILEGGKNALAKKSFRSARFSLIKNLLALNTGNILSFQSKSEWESDEIIYKRVGANIIYVANSSVEDWEDLLNQNNISIIYISTIQQESLAINDFGYIIQQAHKANIPVVVDNTHGGLGHIYAPLRDGADFVLTDVSSSSIFKNIPAKGFIVEGLKTVVATTIDFTSENTFLEKFKQDRVLPVKNNFIVSDQENYIGKLLTKEAKKHGDFSRTANYVARWLNNQTEVMEVNYPGLKASENHIHAELYFKGGYGSLFRFSLWDNEYGYSLLKGFFRSGKVQGVSVDVDYDRKEFIVAINTENYTHVLHYFQKVFSNLKQNIEFKQQITKENNLKRLFDNELKQLLSTPRINKR